MEKIFFVLLAGLLCIVSGLAPSVQPNASSRKPKTASQLGELSQPTGAQLISFMPPTPEPNLTRAQPVGQPASGSGKVLAMDDRKLRVARLKKAHPLKGYTSGNKNIDALIIAAAARNNLDPVLLYSVMHQESAFNPRAVSPQGARGLMQLIPATATRFGVRNIFNPQQNIEAGARYLRFLLDTFEGDLNLALAAYNAGEGNVKKYLGQIPPFRETLKYVSEIKRRYEAINNAPPQTAARGGADFDDRGSVNLPARAPFS